MQATPLFFKEGTDGQDLDQTNERDVFDQFGFGKTATAEFSVIDNTANLDHFSQFDHVDSQEFSKVKPSDQDQNVQMFDALSPFKDEPRKANQFTKKLADANLDEGEPAKKFFVFKDEYKQADSTIQKPSKVEEKVGTIQQKSSPEQIELPFAQNQTPVQPEVKSTRADEKRNDFNDVFDHISKNDSKHHFDADKSGVQETNEAFWNEASQIAGDISVTQSDLKSQNGRSHGQPFKMDDFESVVSQSKNDEKFENSEILPITHAQNHLAHFAEDEDGEEFFKQADISAHHEHEKLSKSINLNTSKNFREDEQTNQNHKISHRDKVPDLEFKFQPGFEPEADGKDPFKIQDDISPIVSKKVTDQVQEYQYLSAFPTPDTSQVFEPPAGVVEPTKHSEFDPFRHGFKAFGEDTMSKFKHTEHGSFLKTNDKKILISSPQVIPEISHFTGAANIKNQIPSDQPTKKKPQKLTLESPSPMSQKHGFDLSEPTPKVTNEDELGAFRFDKSSARISEQLHDSSNSKIDETVELEEFGKSKLSEHDGFFDGIE